MFYDGDHHGFPINNKIIIVEIYPRLLLWVRVAHLFNFLCCVCFLFVFVLCLVCPMLSECQNCPFVIVPSVSSISLFRINMSNREQTSIFFKYLPIYIYWIVCRNRYWSTTRVVESSFTEECYIWPFIW